MGFFGTLLTVIIGAEIIKEGIGPAIKKLGELAKLGGIAASKVMERATRTRLLTYRDVTEYFAKERPDNKLIVRGCACKQGIENEKGFDVYLLFLDKDNRPVMDGRNVPYGTVCRVAEIDKELMNAFGGKDLIIFE